MATITGLSSAEVTERVKAGQVNSTNTRPTKTYPQILIDNLCTGFNLLLLLLGAALIITDPVKGLINALAVSGIIFLNVIISTIQECKAKRRLDKIALLLIPKVTVIRDGEPTVVSQEQIVKDDVILLSAGDQALVDGTLLEENYLEMDESLLTGESHTVRKKVGETVYSGSYCVVGDGMYRVEAFGDNSFASKIIASARKPVKKKTPLQMETTTIMLMLMSIAILYSVIATVAYLLTGRSVAEILQVVAVTLEIVPIALFLLIVISYMVSAIRMADSGVLLQDSCAVESISHVDTVCMDKTGTITTNKLKYKEEHLFDDPAYVEASLRAFVGNVGGKNRTIDALEERYPGIHYEKLQEIRFTSENKYSAAKLMIDGKVRTFYMGAFSVLERHMSNAPGMADIVSRCSTMGLRSVVFCEAVDDIDIEASVGFPQLKPLAVYVIEDEVRSDCRETIEVFLENGMDLKVISGDDPVTVDALFTIANIPGERRIVSGDQLAELSARRTSLKARLSNFASSEGVAKTPSYLAIEKELQEVDAEYNDCILNTNIFGRMKPDQKEEVIDVLRSNGRYVAMVGDGVNDVKSLKRANVGVALESGSGAARGVSEMVLVKDNFAALPKALLEGRRTVSGMRDILKIYISRNFVLAILIAMTLIVFNKPPFNPVQNTFYSVVAVAVSSFFMTFWAKPSDNDDLILPNVLKYAIPTALSIALFGLCIIAVLDIAFMEGYLYFPGFDKYGTFEESTSAALVLFLTFCGVFQLLVVSPYFKLFSLDGVVHKDKRILALIVCLSVIALFCYNFGPTLRLMSVPQLPFWLQIQMVALAFLWLFVQRWIMKWRRIQTLDAGIQRRYLKALESNQRREDEKERS